MPIDTTVPGSPGWWLAALLAKLNKERGRLQLMDDYFCGQPPLPTGARGARRAYEEFQRKARTNYSELIVEAARERMIPVGFRTGAAGDDNGDEQAWRIWQANGLDVGSVDVHQWMLSMGRSYVIVGPPAADLGTGLPLITAEDPRQVVTAHDPRYDRRVLAALKVFYDDVAGRELVYLWLPAGQGRRTAELRVAGRDVTVRRDFTGAAGGVPALADQPPRPTPGVSAWEWDDSLSGPLAVDQVPVVRFKNRRGVGEYEHHVDLLDRINHMLLQRLVIATMQAFRQRAIKGDLPERDPNTGELINYDAVFAADPGALWKLPEGLDMWESGQADLTPILAAVRDDVKDLAAVTRTPLHYFTPDAANGSAEGASLMREGLVFKVEDRCTRAGAAWAQVMSLAFRFADDAERADLLSLQVMWGAAERYSLAERYDAAVKGATPGVSVPRKVLWSDVLGFDPDQVARMQSEAADEALLQPQLAAAGQAATPGRVTPGPGTPAPATAGRAPVSAGPVSPGRASTGRVPARNGQQKG